jgi:hypothetical protein
MSQSIFLARIIVYRDGKAVSPDGIEQYTNLNSDHQGIVTAVCYSNPTLYTTIGWESALVVFLLLVAGICTYPKGCPAGGTNSAVISAACHVKYKESEQEKLDGDVADQPVMWGVAIPGNRERVGHCCFSSGEVERPKVGYLYAGTIAKTKIA